jgi:hypothetical protein
VSPHFFCSSALLLLDRPIQITQLQNQLFDGAVTVGVTGGGVVTLGVGVVTFGAGRGAGVTLGTGLILGAGLILGVNEGTRGTEMNRASAVVEASISPTRAAEKSFFMVVPFTWSAEQRR